MKGRNKGKAVEQDSLNYNLVIKKVLVPPQGICITFFEFSAETKTHPSPGAGLWLHADHKHVTPDWLKPKIDD